MILGPWICTFILWAQKYALSKDKGISDLDSRPLIGWVQGGWKTSLLTKQIDSSHSTIGLLMLNNTQGHISILTIYLQAAWIAWWPERSLKGQKCKADLYILSWVFTMNLSFFKLSSLRISPTPSTVPHSNPSKLRLRNTGQHVNVICPFLIQKVLQVLVIREVQSID